MATTTTTTLSQEIDTLLEHYLHLLDQYTTLRSQLSSAQSSIQQNLARANFTAERGVRYGKDCYDERMHAVRTCSITSTSSPGYDDSSSTGGGGVEFGIQSSLPTAKSKQEGDLSDQKEAPAEDTEGNDEKKDKEKEPKPTPKDPLRMFGILTPQALRTAQNEAVEMVEEIIPKLVGVGREMEGVEIEIRRRRKWLLKAASSVGAEPKGKQVGVIRGGGLECGS